MSLVTLVFGSLLAGIGGIIAIYSREAVRKAHKQKSAAIRLRAYMMFWRSYLLENELGMLLVLADRLENKINSTYKSSGSQGVVDLKNELKDALKNTPIDVNSDAFLKTKENILNFSEKNIEHAIDSIDLLRQNIFDGKTFITDEEATLLGLGVSYYSVEYKMRVGSLLDTLKYLILQLHDKEAPLSNERLQPQIIGIIQNGVWLIVYLNKLIRISDILATKSILKMTLKNLI